MKPDYEKNLIPADINVLNPEDKVYIAYPLKFGITPFRYPHLREETIVRITPKKTKLVTNKNEHIVANTKIYLENDEAHRLRAIAGYVIAGLNTINDISYHRYSIRKLTDEQIHEFTTHILAASAILDTAKEKE